MKTYHFAKELIKEVSINNLKCHRLIYSALTYLLHLKFSGS